MKKKHKHSLKHMSKKELHRLVTHLLTELIVLKRQVHDP